MQRQTISKCANMACTQQFGDAVFEEVCLQAHAMELKPVVLVLCRTCAEGMRNVMLDAEHGVLQS